MKLLQKAETVAAERRAKIEAEIEAANAKDALQSRQNENTRFKPLVEILLRDIRGKSKQDDAESLADLMHGLNLSPNGVAEHRLFLARYLEAQGTLKASDQSAAKAELAAATTLSRGWSEYAKQEHRKVEARPIPQESKLGGRIAGASACCARKDKVGLVQRDSPLKLRA